MGINTEEAKLILALRLAGRVGDEILCLGRPERFISASEVGALAKGFNLGWSAEQAKAISTARFAEPFLEAAGFSTIRSMDVSPYECADIIHDLNAPLPTELEGTSSFVYDGGTIEHVFDVAEAIRNVMKLTRVGGTILLSSPANGQCGHGFYQFSPELFYRVLAANGFADIEIYVVAMLSPARWFKVTDPRILRRRVQFSTSEAMQMLVVARKERNFDTFTVPQQSDYADLQWQDEAPVAKTRLDIEQASRDWLSRNARIRGILRDRLIYPALVVTRHMLGLGMPGLWRRQHFMPVDPFSL